MLMVELGLLAVGLIFAGAGTTRSEQPPVFPVVESSGRSFDVVVIEGDDGAERLGLTPSIQFAPEDGAEGRWGRITSELGPRPMESRWEGDALQLDSFELVLERPDGTELLRLPIVVWSDR